MGVGAGRCCRLVLYYVLSGWTYDYNPNNIVAALVGSTVC